MREKEQALEKFINLTKNSWTYERLTQKEREKLLNVLNNCITQEALKGTFEHRWNILQAIYKAFLDGIGYSDYSWRERNI